MSEEVSTTKSTNIFEQQIQEEANRERENILSRAESHARDIIRKNEKEIEEYQTSTMERVQRQAEIKLRTIQSHARVQFNRKQLQLQEKVLQTVFDKAASELAASESPDDLLLLIAEAIMGIGQESVTLYVDEKYMNVVEKDILFKVEQLLKQQEFSMPEITVRTLSEHPRDLGTNRTGVITTSSDGRIEFDNTVDARMQRMESMLRAIADSHLKK